ncbi:hypothetical protein [Phytoactinopolyspora endophytica]|uniref:hypothetical protein n=1 Tax=Phytoactinopolyspora endophytica TaxID=1642495 RepID=UPI00101E0FA0|nr:hypothetical protein [Phytoactinopolyspora endophytica]
MATRDRLRERAQPYLRPGENIEQVFQAQSGPSPYFFLLTWLTLFWHKFYIVAVTDQSIVMVRTGHFVNTKPKGDDPVEARLPRRTRIGPVSGLWASTSNLGPKRLWIHRYFHKDVDAADAALDQPDGPLA